MHTRHALCAGRLQLVKGCHVDVCRTIHFFASSDKAKRELGWKPQHNFLKDVDALVADYKALARESKDIDFSIDDKILAAVGAK